MLLPLTTPLMAELLALRHGLAIAKANNLNPIIIEIDSSTIIPMLANDHPSYHNIIIECRSLMEDM